MSTQAMPIQAKADANGNAIAKFPPFTPGVRRTVSQVSISNTSSVNNTTQSGTLLFNSLLVTSTTSNVDAAVGEPSITVMSHDTLEVVWAGLDANAVGTAVFYYEDERPNR